MPLNNKLYFYNIVKSEITFEPYLKINEYERRRALAQLRSSNNHLNCETERYDLNKSPKYNSKLEIDYGGSVVKLTVVIRLKHCHIYHSLNQL